MSNEFGRIKSEDVTALGYVPRISIDLRIRCPRLFTEKYPCPAPPSLRYATLASQAASQILTATWAWRQYLEVIKIGYTLDEDVPEPLHLTAEMIIITPVSDEKTSIKAREVVGLRNPYHFHREDMGMTFALDGPDESYSARLNSLSQSLVQEAKRIVQSWHPQLDKYVRRLGEFQTAFE